MTHPRLILSGLVWGVSLLWTCAAEADKKTAAAQAAGAETLARLASVDHWKPLFNGTDLTGWQGDTVGYKVVDGVLVCEAGAKVLETAAEYGDFVFRFEFKLTESGNNGIGIRVPAGGYAAYDGMELQILDDRGDRYHAKIEDGTRINRLLPTQYHGSLYGVVPALPGFLRPLEEWNEQVIICIEDHLKVVLNGAVILDTYLDDVQPVDGRVHPGLKRRSGHIQLAGHNDHIEFRKLELADYSASPPLPDNKGDLVAPTGFSPIFNGTDLSGWKGLADGDANKRRALTGDDLVAAQAKADELMKAHWSVVDGILTYDGQGQSLCTAKDYGDFEFYVDWKIPSGADSGIYLRGTPQIQIWDPWDSRTKDGPPTSPEAWVEAYKTGRNLGSGGLWNNRRASNRPLVLADKPIGEWNTFLIRMIGEKVSIWLNGKQVVDRTVLENFWDKENDRTIPIVRADQIELQHHGSALYFKNLYLREIPY